MTSLVELYLGDEIGDVVANQGLNCEGVGLVQTKVSKMNQFELAYSVH